MRAYNAVIEKHHDTVPFIRDIQLLRDAYSHGATLKEAMNCYWTPGGLGFIEAYQKGNCAYGTPRRMTRMVVMRRHGDTSSFS